MELTVVSTVATLLATIGVVKPEIILLDLSMSLREPRDAVHLVHRTAPGVPLIVIAESARKQQAERSLKQGAMDYVLRGSIDLQRLARVLSAALERNSLQRVTELLRDPLTELYTRDGLLTVGSRRQDEAHGNGGALVLVCALFTSFVLGGPSVPFLKASVYQEAILWEGVFASVFLVLALRGLTAPEGFSPRTLLLMAVVAGCCLLTRVVMATGLYTATLVLIAWRFGDETSRRPGAAAGPIRPGLRAGFRLLSTRRFMVPLMVLALFAAAAGFINHKRFGNPLVFHNPTLQTIVRPHGVPALERAEPLLKENAFEGNRSDSPVEGEYLVPKETA